MVSKSFVLFMARTRAATICGELRMTCRLASFRVKWWTMTAARATTTWSSSFNNLISSGTAKVARSASFYKDWRQFTSRRRRMLSSGDLTTRERIIEERRGRQWLRAKVPLLEASSTFLKSYYWKCQAEKTKSYRQSGKNQTRILLLQILVAMIFKHQ